MAVWAGPTLLVLALLALLAPTLGGLALITGFGVLVLMTAAWISSQSRLLTARLELPDRLVLGESTTLAVVVTNRSLLPTSRVRVRVHVPSGGFEPSESVFEVALLGRSACRLTTSVTATARGRWQPEPPEIVVSDPWGLHQLAVAGAQPPPVVVLPALVPVRRTVLPAVSSMAEVPASSSLFHDETSIVGVRPYQPGDPLRSIHWPATAASGTLVRRETERAWARELLVVLDLDLDSWVRGEQRPSESAVTVAASLLVDAILGSRQPAGLVTSLAPPEPARGSRQRRSPTAAAFRIGQSRSHLDAMLVHLASVRLHAAVPLPELVRRHVRRQQPGTTVAIVTSGSTALLADALQVLHVAGLSTAVIEVANPHVLERRQSAPPTAGAPLISVPTDRTLTRLRL